MGDYSECEVPIVNVSPKNRGRQILITGRTRGEAKTHRLGVVRNFEKGLKFNLSLFVV